MLYPAPLRDLWMRLAVVSAFEPRWSDLIHDEWIRNVRVNRPDIPLEQLERSRRLMDLHALEAKVTGFEHRIPTLELPDPDDRHVLAAALHAGVGVIVTFNLRDFPQQVLAPLGVLAQHPDPFTLALFETNPDAVLEALAQQRRALTRPPLTAEPLLTLLERQGLGRTVAALRPHLERI